MRLRRKGKKKNINGSVEVGAAWRRWGVKLYLQVRCASPPHLRQAACSLPAVFSVGGAVFLPKLHFWAVNNRQNLGLKMNFRGVFAPKMLFSKKVINNRCFFA